MKINFTWVFEEHSSKQVYEEHGNMQEDVCKKFRGLLALNAGGILKEKKLRHMLRFIKNRNL